MGGVEDLGENGAEVAVFDDVLDVLDAAFAFGVDLEVCCYGLCI